jgi:transcriptional regulator with XRE-family HTH domain
LIVTDVPKRANVCGVKADSERGVIGAWAFHARAEADLSVEEVAERVAAKGQAVKPATIRGIESGNKRPGVRLLRLLAAVLDSTPPGFPAIDEPDEPALATALLALAAELAAMREERLAMRSELDDLSALVRRLVARDPDAPGLAEQPVPRAPGRSAG